MSNNIEYESLYEAVDQIVGSIQISHEKIERLEGAMEELITIFLDAAENIDK